MDFKVTGTAAGITDQLFPLRIGNESNTNTNTGTHFEGNITNFRWTKGIALYNSLSLNQNNLTVATGTKILLLTQSPLSAFTDTASTKTIISNNL